MYAIELIDRTGAVRSCPMQVTVEDDRIFCSFPKALITADIQAVKVLPGFMDADSGVDGYYVIPEMNTGSMLFRFRARDDDEYISHATYIMPVMGVKRGESAHLLVLTGMKYDYDMVAGVRNGRYYAYFQLNLAEHPLYEDIAVAIYELRGKDANYSGMARKYRWHQFEYGGIRPLSARAQEREALKYMLDAVEIRIRHAWKPAPPTIMHQTPENEPPMHVAITFQRVEELIAELKKQGVEKAELCLVGWNVKGHDGRWPQIFPVEPELGGEEGLRHLIQTAKDAGYQIVCHTNSTDAYTIADCWDEEFILKDRNGFLETNSEHWSGGKMYHICPKRALEMAQTDLPQVAALGFQGVHYIDVVSVVPPRTCYDPRHPVTKQECVDDWNRIFRLAKEQIGGIASEGCYDFAAPELDFGLYAAFNLFGKHPALCDEVVPFWQLVYHGIIASNPSGETFNMPIKEPKARLTFYEYGGRPVIYYYAKFTNNSFNRKGDDDFRCDTQEQLEKSVGQIKHMMDEYNQIKDLQYCYMYSHETLEPGITRVVYENGTQMVFNYTEKPYSYREREIAPMDFSVFR